MTITNSPTSKLTKKKSAAPAASTRLPSARERRPALAALAVLLIAGGAVLAGWLALRQSQTESYLMVNTTISEGDEIQAGDLDRIELPKENVNFISADSGSEVVGSYAQAELLEGTPLIPNMLGDKPRLADDESRIGLDLDVDQYPSGLTKGDVLNVVKYRDDGESNAQELTTTGVIDNVEQTETGSGSVFAVIIPAACYAEFLIGATDSRVALAEMPAGAEPVTCEKPETSTKESP